MKLKTKFQDEDFDLGEVVDASIMYGFEDKIEVCCIEKMKHRKYGSIKDFTDHWEDAPEEPKGIKDIYFTGATVYIEMYNQKEAIEVEEKLKAFRRLKDKGFKFDGYGRYHWTGEEWPHVAFSYPNFDDLFDDSETVANLDLLFSGEDD